MAECERDLQITLSNPSTQSVVNSSVSFEYPGFENTSDLTHD